MNKSYFSRNSHQISTETCSDTENNISSSRTFYNNNVPSKNLVMDSTSAASSSKLNHSIAHSIPSKIDLNASTMNRSPFLMVKSKSDLNSLKTYPDSFTILASPRKSPSAGYNNKNRRPTLGGVAGDDDDDDSIIDIEWNRPPPDKLYEAAKAAENLYEEPDYVIDEFGQHVSVPTSPILTDTVVVGSSHR